MMRNFYFDLIAPPRNLFWLRALLLLAGGLALGAVVVYEQASLSPKLAQQRSLVQAEVAKLGALAPVSRMKPAELAQAWQFARQASVQLNLPWQNFFVQLGSASASGNVALISIEPDSQKGHVVVVAEARTLEDMLQFVTQLQKSPDFSDVTLQSHTVVQNVPENPVRFRLSATWRREK